MVELQDVRELARVGPVFGNLGVVLRCSVFGLHVGPVGLRKAMARSIEEGVLAPARIEEPLYSLVLRS